MITTPSAALVPSSRSPRGASCRAADGSLYAGVAQQVEHPPCKWVVASSNPASGSIMQFKPDQSCAPSPSPVSGIAAPTCALCGGLVRQSVSAINRAAREGRPIYCGRKCSGLARRKLIQPDQKKEAKRLYDARRRQALRDEIREKKREYHKRTYDPAKAAIERKARMPRHLEYCRRHEYREWKSAYDQQRRAKIMFGEFAESALLLMQVESEIERRATRQEIAQTNGTYNKAQRRKRELT